MPENYMFGRRPPFRLCNKDVRIIVGEPIGFDVSKLKQKAADISRHLSFSYDGWPKTVRGLDEGAQRCLYTTILEQIRGVIERLRSTMSDDYSLLAVISFEAMEMGVRLAARFLEAMEMGYLDKILDDQVLGEGRKEEVVAISRLAQRCLNLQGRMKLTMNEVVAELESIRMSRMPAALSVEDKGVREEASFDGDKMMMISDFEYSWMTSGIKVPHRQRLILVR